MARHRLLGIGLLLQRQCIPESATRLDWKRRQVEWFGNASSNDSQRPFGRFVGRHFISGFREISIDNSGDKTTARLDLDGRRQRLEWMMMKHSAIGNDHNSGSIEVVVSLRSI